MGPRKKPKDISRNPVEDKHDTEDEARLRDDEHDSLMSELNHDAGTQAPRMERHAVTSGRSKLRNQSECLLEGSGISDFLSEDEYSNAEELNFAAEDEQMEARLAQVFSQQDLDIPECEDVGRLQDWDEAEHESFVQLTSAIGQDGFKPLISKAIEAEAASGSSLGKKYLESRGEWNFNAILTLCSMDSKVIGQLTSGNLVLATQQDDSLRERLELFYKQSKSQPSIYARVHVSRDGSAMSVKDALRLVKWLRRYTSEDPAIVRNGKAQQAMWHVDREFSKRWSRANTDAGSRRSLISKSGVRSEDRVKVLQKFCDQLQGRCEASGETSGEDSLLSRPLLYIGYAHRVDRRRRQHEACGSTSNWLASLVQATCNVLWGRGSYRMHFFTICLLSEEPQGPVAEMLLTRIPGAYYHGGSGFCIDIAGKSMESIHFRELSHAEARDCWAEYDEWVEHNTPVNENWAAELAVKAAKAEARRQRKEKRKEKRAEDMKRLLEAYRSCEELKTYPDWADNPKTKAAVEYVEGVIRRFEGK